MSLKNMGTFGEILFLHVFIVFSFIIKHVINNAKFVHIAKIVANAISVIHVVKKLRNAAIFVYIAKIVVNVISVMYVVKKMRKAAIVVQFVKIVDN